MDITRRKISFSIFPRHFWVGLLLILFAWPLNWLLPGLRTHLLFFPLWLGYILVVDGLVLYRKQTSLLTRSRRAFVGLFLVSMPIWWLFEAINWRTQNWSYLGRENFSDLAYFVLASLSFSTVIPAVFGTAELVSTMSWLKRLPKGPTIKPVPAVLWGFFLVGLAMLSAMIIWPKVFFPFIWLSFYFILAPINVWLGNRSLAEHTAVSNWRPVVSLWMGALICGFFWEMWNFYAFPKWVYHVPPFEFLHIFEMPLLGYGGYLPFGLELFAFYQFVVGLLGAKQLARFVQISE
ncbi:MAG: hypothetical protein WAM60_20050 [Candidatus Promineifilaceae bacterium]